MMTSPFDSLTFSHGPAMANRFMLAPLTNSQSHDDGSLSDEEFTWLTKRAEGHFGMVMTCASHVQRTGRGFPGQLGCWSDDHLPGLTRLASAIKAQGSVALLQLHHAGRRAPEELTGQSPVAPGPDPNTQARALTTEEVKEVIEDFVVAAERCDQAGFDGVELHGAHDYLLCEFLNADLNNRTDEYGGNQENRYRIFAEIIEGVRGRCSENFMLGVRLSPEHFGLVTADVIDVFNRLVATNTIDFIDLSMWDTFKEAAEEELSGQTLLSLFTGLDRGATRLIVAGHLYNGADVQRALDLGADVVALGKAAIANHNFPELMRDDPGVAMREIPIPRSVLADEGLSPTFIDYMAGWQGFVTEEESA